MDLKRIFDLFNEDHNNSNKGYYDEASLLVDFSEHPLYWISGFNKVIDNHIFFKNYTAKTFKNISPDINLEELEIAGEELMHSKAWDYIKNLDINKAFHLEYIKAKATKEFASNLQLCITFYERFEEYEKCALLKGIENKVNEFLA